MKAPPSPGSHPDRNELRGFLAGEMRGEELPAIEDHLRQGCVNCILTAQEIMAHNRKEETKSISKGLGIADAGPGEPEAFIERYGSQLQRRAMLLEAEQKVAPGLIAELMLRAPVSRRSAVRESRRYQILAVSESLRSESKNEVSRDIARALELSELAAEVADCLDTGVYGAAMVADVRALAWANVGNSRRVAADFFNSERAFQTALRLLESGSGSPSEVAEVESLLGSLRAEQARFQEAVQLLRNAAAAYRELGLSHQEGRVLAKLGTTAFIAGQPSQALRFFESAIDLLDPNEDPKTHFLAHHNIAACLNECRASEDARQYFEELAPGYESFSQDPAMQTRRRWLEGLIEAGTGRSQSAIDILREIREVFAQAERAYDNALVTLDLAAVYLQVGNLEEVKRLAQEMYPIFRSQDIHREALAALLLFERAAAAETATAALAQDVARYLSRARNNPYLRYEPSLQPND